MAKQHKHKSNKSKKNKHKKTQHHKERKIRYCLLCGQPHQCKTELCIPCQTKKKYLNTKIMKWFNISKPIISNGKLVSFQKKYHLEDEDVFEVLKNKKALSALLEIPRWEYKADKYEVKENPKITYLEKEVDSIPIYIRNWFKGKHQLQLITTKGLSDNPLVYFRNVETEVDFCFYFNDLKNNPKVLEVHGGSSGEILVNEFLKSLNLKYLREFQTLKCINPITKRVLPYDFEIPSYKLIIEVQGSQHKEFTPKFHGSIENFKYQLYRDKVKKNFAIKHGYKFVEIWYEDFIDSTYKQKILDAMNEA